MPAELVDLYLRKSTKDEGRSAERQLAELTDSAADMDLAIGQVYCDPEFSASRFARKARPDFPKLMERIRSGECRVIGLFEVSRGSRQLTEWSTLLDECRDRQIRIWIWADERVYRPWKTGDWDTLARMGVDAATESNKTSDRVTSGKRKAAREGRPPGKLQYGFTRRYDERGKLVRTFDADGNPIDQVPHPEQAAVVAEVVKRVIDGDSMRAISLDLNQRGLVKPSGKPWEGVHLRQMILSPSLIGRRIHRGEDVGRAAWAPLVDEGEWRRAVAILTAPGRQAPSRGTLLAHWLTNVAACGRCGEGRLISMSRNGIGRALRYGCKACNGVFVEREPFEAFVELVILARLKSADALAAFQPVDGPAVREAEKQVAELNARLDAHYVEAAAGRLSARGLTAVEGPLLAEIRAAEQKSRRLILPAALRDVDPGLVVARWPGMAPEQKRSYVRALAEIVVSPATRGMPSFDRNRLRESRWSGDSRTWQEHGLLG